MSLSVRIPQDDIGEVEPKEIRWIRELIDQVSVELHFLYPATHQPCAPVSTWPNRLDEPVLSSKVSSELFSDDNAERVSHTEPAREKKRM